MTFGIHLKTIPCLLIVLAACGAAPDPAGEEVGEQSETDSTSVSFTQIESQTGGTEAFNSFSPTTANQHGGSFEYIFTFEPATAQNIAVQMSFGGTALTNDSTSSNAHGRLRRWPVPANLRGTTGYATVTAVSIFGSNGSTSWRIRGSQSCYGNCGTMAAGGCWCDSLCSGYGDCCSDKASYCPTLPQCNCSPACKITGNCCTNKTLCL